jgi:hypothetical protein
LSELGESIEFTELPGNLGGFFCGRVPANRLISFAAPRIEIPSSREYLDLGGNLRTLAAAPAGAVCATLLARTADVHTADACVVVVDRGLRVPGGTPDNFGGKLSHLETTDVEMSDHALSVLSVLLERLDHHGVLGRTHVACALVCKPVNRIGSRCFEHDNAVELGQVLKKVGAWLNSCTVPACINLSFGFHVGPHNGDSPVEDLIAGTTSSGSSRGLPRFFFVAAGNDGAKGLYGQRELSGGVSDFLSLRLGPTGCSEVLVEFWWREFYAAPVDIKVEVKDSKGVPIFLRPLLISGATAATGFASAPVPAPGKFRQSLIYRRCHKDMSCAAFALSVTNAHDLRSADIDFTFSTGTDLLVNAWLSVCEDDRSAFIGGGLGGTVCVPATSTQVVSVAGVNANGQPLFESSRGPSAVYPHPIIRGARVTSCTPLMAHLATSGTATVGQGTSYSSARACADGTFVVLDPARRSRCSDSVTMTREILGLGGGGSGGGSSWSPQTGYGGISI